MIFFVLKKKQSLSLTGQEREYPPRHTYIWTLIHTSFVDISLPLFCQKNCSKNKMKRGDYFLLCSLFYNETFPAHSVGQEYYMYLFAIYLYILYMHIRIVYCTYTHSLIICIQWCGKNLYWTFKCLNTIFFFWGGGKDCSDFSVSLYSWIKQICPLNHVLGT